MQWGFKKVKDWGQGLGQESKGIRVSEFIVPAECVRIILLVPSHSEGPRGHLNIERLPLCGYVVLMGTCE